MGGHPSGTAAHHPRGTQPPAGHESQRNSARTPTPTARGQRTPAARPDCGQPGEDGRLTSGAPRNGARHHLRGAPCAHNVGPVLGPPHCPSRGHTGNRSSQPDPRDGRLGEEKRLTPDAPHNGGKPPPPGWPPTTLAARCPLLMGSGPRLPPAPGTGSTARGGQAPLATAAIPPQKRPGGARKPVQGPHTHTTHAEGTRATGPGCPRGEGKRLTPDAPRNDATSRWGDPPPPFPRCTAPCRGHVPKGRRRDPTPTHPRPTHMGNGPRLPDPTSGRPGEAERLMPPRARERPAEPREALARGGIRCGANVRLPHPHPTKPTARATKRAATAPGQPQEVRTPSPALRHSNAMVEPTAPRKTRPRSATLDAAHEVIRALGLRGGGGTPRQRTRTRTATWR